MLCSAVRVWALMIGCVSLAMHPGTMLAESDQRLFQVELDETLGVQKRSGRLFVFVTESPTNRPRSSIEWFRPTPFFAIDVSEMEPGHSVDVDESATGFPDKLSTLPDGKYFAHALLHHSLDDGDPGRAQGNYYSESVPFEVVKDKPFNVQLTLKKILPPRTSNESAWVKDIAVPCPKLSEFHGRQVVEQARIILPESYGTTTERRYPVIYCIPSFNVDQYTNWNNQVGSRTAQPGEAEFILVMLNGQSAWGHHVYANSATNGPRGDSLVEELIPFIDENFRTIAAPTARFLTGHSSGGWSSLWLQINYPDTFGGTWASAPDPVDFRNFMGIDIYAQPSQNAYVDTEGRRRPASRPYRGDTLYWDSFSRMDDAYGRGGQLKAFEAVFSPLGPEGKPLHIFNRTSGQVNSSVAEAWKKYDIRLHMEKNWPQLRDKLAGKLHIVVGDRDTFFLDLPMYMLADSLKSLGGDADIAFQSNGTHFTTLTNDWRTSLRKAIAESIRVHHATDYGDLPKAEETDTTSPAARLIANASGPELDLTSQPSPRQARAFIVDDASLVQIAGLKQLEKLALPPSKFTAEALGRLAELPKLRELRLTLNEASLPLLQAISGLPHLEKLTLTVLKLGEPEARAIAQMRALRELSTGAGTSGSVIRAVCQSNSLERLSMRSAHAGNFICPALVNLSSLRELDVSFTDISARGLLELGKHPGLEKLTIRGVLAPDSIVEEIEAERRSRKQSTIEIVTGNSPYQVLQSDPNQLQQLNFTGRNVGHEPQRLDRISGYATVPCVILSRSLIDEQAANKLANMENLRNTLTELQMQGTNISLVGDRLLLAFSKLRKVDLRGAVLGESTLTPLGKLQELENLSLNSTDVTDEQLKAIRGMESIRELNLGKCTKVTDASLGTILSLRGLRLLDVQETALTRAAIDALRSEMPATRIRGDVARRWEWQFEDSKADGATHDIADHWRPSPPSYARDQVLIDASKARENWWASQRRDDLDPRNPHQLRLAPQFLRQQGFQVTVVPPGSTITADVLQQHDIIIRTQCISPYTEEELTAYKERVENGGLCILVGYAHYDDRLAERFGLEFSAESQASQITTARDHAMTRSVGSRYGPFCTLEKYPTNAQCLASLTTDATPPVLGSWQFGQGMLLAMGMDAVDDRDERLLSDVVKSLASFESVEAFTTSLRKSELVAIGQPRLAAPELISPAVDAEFPHRSRHEWNLKWKPVTGIRMAQVLVQAPSRELSLDLETPQERGEVLLRPSPAFRPDASQRSGWYWQVRLKTDAGEFGKWSPPQPFTVAAVEEFTEPLPPLGPIEGSWLVAENPNSSRNSFVGGERWFLSTGFGRESKSMIWDLEATPPELVVDVLVQGNVRSAPPITSNGKWAVASIGQRDQGQSRLINLLEKDHPEFLFEHPGNVTAHHFSGNGEWYISRTKDSNRLWNLATEDPSATFETINEPQNSSQMQPFVFDRSRRWLVAGNRLIDLNNTAPLASSKLLPNDNFNPVGFSSDGNWLVAGNCLVDMRAQELGQDRLFALPKIDSFSNLSFSTSQHVLLIGNLYVRLDSDDPSQQITSLPISDGQFDAFALSKDGRYVTAANAQNLVVWDLQDLATTPLQRNSFGPGGGNISFPMSFHLKLHFSDDNRWLVSTSYDGDATLYDLTKPDLAAKKLTGDRSSYRIIGFTRNGRWLYVGAGNKVNLWDLTGDSVGAPDSVVELFEGETRWTGIVSQSQDGRWLVCNDRKSLPLLYDLSQESPFEKPVTIDHPNSFGVLSPDGRYFITRYQADFGARLPNNQPADLRLWSLVGENPGEQYVSVPGHYGDVNTSTFSSHGRWLLIGDARSTRMWDVAHLNSVTTN